MITFGDDNVEDDDNAGDDNDDDNVGDDEGVGDDDDDDGVGDDDDDNGVGYWRQTGGCRSVPRSQLRRSHNPF